jgi:hypothetical protein
VSSSATPKPAWRRTLAALLAALAMPGIATAQAAGLGLCPADAKQRDGYTQALCDGEEALRSGKTAEALDRFRAAANLPRPSATNELAWAGLAAANCRAGDLAEGRRWAAHFAEARRLWQGDLDCQAASGRPTPGPFVQSRMCGPGVVADYALVRGNAQAAYVQDLRARLQRIDEALRKSCDGGPTASNAAPAATPAGTTPAPTAKSSRSKKTTRQKPPPTGAPG